jgi:DNA-binding CsgD family transcriptional regulator
VSEHVTPAPAGLGVGLLQREPELEALDGWVAEARAGRGRVTLIRGSAGIGKTALLDRAVALGAQQGLCVRTARGSELEEQLPFGVARQLFEGLLHGLDAGGREAALTGAAHHAGALFALKPAVAGGGADLLGLIHGLFWLTSNLADRSPLLLAIDDLHWADAQTLQWVSYLADRISEVPVLLVAAVRDGEARREAELAGLLQAPEVVSVQLTPLGVPAVGDLVRTAFDRAGEPPFVEACHTAGGGNPFFVRELLRAAVEDGIEPTTAHVSRVHRLGPPEVARSIVGRLRRLPESSTQMARAVAILGVDAELRHVAQLAGMTVDEALSAWDVLVRAQILQSRQPLDFIHPIARAAVYEELPIGERTRGHRMAAAILAFDGAAPQRIAAHAMACAPAGDAELVKWLRAAAAQVMATAAPGVAAQYLRRALEEPPPPEERPQLHYELGQALSDSDVTAAAENLERAAATAEDASLRTLAHRWSGYALVYSGATAEGIAAFDAAAKLATDADEELLIAGSRDIFAAWWLADPHRDRRLREGQERARGRAGTTPGERRVLAAAAINLCLTGTAPVAEVLSLIEICRGSGVSFSDRGEGDETAGTVGTVALLCDDPAASVYRELWAETVGEGRILQGTFLRSIVSQVELRRGGLIEAEEHARACWEMFAPLAAAPTTMFWWALTPLLDVMIERGLAEEASALADSCRLSDAVSDVAIFPSPAVTAGRLAVAQGRCAEGITTLLAAGARLTHQGFANPSHIPWRAHAAAALASCGRMEEAREVIGVGLAQARQIGSPWALGMALRVAGTVEPAQAGIALLQESVAVLEASACRLEHAKALVQLGAALRRAGERSVAREHLRSGMDMAARCGAPPLVERARQELAASGARPRRTMLSGPESLTGSERRIAELAAAGRSNPEIAQALFVSRKTVETHLGHAYAKLGISRRDQLPDALGLSSSVS